MKITETLHSDHEKAQEIFQKMEGTSARAVKARMEQFEKLQHELLPHMEAEEKIIYPRLKSDGKPEIVMEAFEEHRAARLWMEVVAKTPFDDETWQAKVKVFGEMIDHHIEEEEGEIFEMMEEELDEEEDEAMDEKFMQLKEKKLMSMK